MSSSLLKGAGYALAGFKFIGRPKLRRYVIVPLLLNLVLFSAALWFGSQWIDGYIDTLLPNWLEWLRFLLWPLLFVAAMLVIFSTFTMLANLLGAPFNGMLAEAVELRLSGKALDTDSETSSLTKDVIGSVSSELGKLLFFGIRAIPLLLLFLIPGINIVAPVVWLLFGAWMLVHQYMDFPMANNNLSFKQQRPILKSKRSMIIGFGLAVMAMTLIPVINFFAMPVAVCGATYMWCEQFKTVQ